MELKRLKGAIEAIIFAGGEPVALERISQVLNLDMPTLEKLVHALMDEYNKEDRGIRIVRLEGCVQMCINSRYSEPVRETLNMRRNTPLSQAAMEVLAVIAYNQPVTKGFVEQIRGVDCSAVIGTLITKGLVEERGRLELPGRPLLYGTTSDFLRCMDIHSLQELPPLPEADKEETDKSTEIKE